MMYEVQTEPQRRKIWVHASDGSTVGRFDARAGIDIHNTVQDQLAGKPQCLHCTHGRPTSEDWRTFRRHARELWSLDIAEGVIDQKWFEH